MKPGVGFEEVDQLGYKFESFVMNELLNAAKLTFKYDVSVARLKDDCVVVTSLNPAVRAQ